MNPVPVIRQMTSQDLDTVLKLEKEVFRDPWSRKSYEFEINGNRFSVPLVLEYQGNMIGHAVAWRIFEEFHIATIAIAPTYQRQGWGRYLLEKLLGFSGGAEYALLEVRRTNIRAIQLYEKFGFKQVTVRRRYYRNGEDAIVMTKLLD